MQKWTRKCISRHAFGRLLSILAVIFMLAGPAYSHEHHDEYETEHDAECVLCSVISAHACGVLPAGPTAAGLIGLISHQLHRHNDAAGEHSFLASPHARAPPLTSSL